MAGGVLQDGGPVCVHGGDGRDTQGKLGSRGGSWRVRQRHTSDVHSFSTSTSLASETARMW